VLAELSRRELVPAIWLPTFTVRQERERARWRLHLIKHRSMLKHRVHAQPRASGAPARCRTCSGVSCSSGSISLTRGAPTC
jgi:hypothetical protein